ncbi:MAG: SPFH domain-containing protein [Rhodanobacteraceae bacterium]|nr:MAG: SPFH domain-containing protein [Rhodanobacteraceae bacterium]
MNETKASSLPGIPIAALYVLLFAGCAALFLYGAAHNLLAAIVLAAVVFAIVAFLCKGFFQVQPNQGMVMLLFGRYAGTARETGLRWTNPFFTRRAVSLRIRNFESSKLKVNDADGNPIEIAAVIVWQVVDTAEAVFQVDDYENYVHIQSESALRQMAQSYPYDSHDDGKPSLRSHGDEITAHLCEQIQERLGKAGVKVLEARISHLAYAQEIAQAMLQRQQAGAIIAARTKIVEGAVSMVQMALQQLSQQHIVELDEERRAAMVSNLLVVLCGERGTQPVLNTGTLYQG